MMLRLVRFTLSEAGRSQAQAMANDLIPPIKQNPGCISAAFFSAEDGESGLCVLWDSQEHADAAAAGIGPRLQSHLAANATGQAEIRLFPVLAS
jgi:quinol monooxygenase YgiN